MATTNNPNQPQGNMPNMPQTQSGQNMGAQGQQNMGGQNVGSPISNEAYDVLTALQAKLEGLEAYRKFANDGNQQFWQQLSQQDNQMVGMLVDQLEKLVKDGRFRMGTPGQATRPTGKA